jgi:hypothetical protein
MVLCQCSLRILFVDVNAVPSAVIKKSGVKVW